ncbi:magnesium transporter [Parelusimicrobium proximum]|uniref:magnesium transporter MgtE N-terminal domain-containing protein n=1 Tax=Parelusimicrobium proximum TaxID=3228953 RepID=UPI003D16ACF5
MYKPSANSISLNMAEKFITSSPKDAAAFLEVLPTHEALQILLALKSELSASAVSVMDTVKAAAVIRRMPVKQAVHILSLINIKRASEIVNALPEHHKIRIKQSVSKDLARELDAAAAYADGSAGSLMSPSFLSFKTDDKLSDIIAKFKTISKKKLPSLVYVLDKQGHLAGIIRSANIVVLQPSASCGSAMLKSESTLQVKDGKETVLQAVKASLDQEAAVTDEEGKMLGVITASALFEYLSESKNPGIFNIFKKK